MKEVGKLRIKIESFDENQTLECQLVVSFLLNPQLNVTTTKRLKTVYKLIATYRCWLQCGRFQTNEQKEHRQHKHGSQFCERV
jgi:hypothetical protein